MKITYHFNLTRVNKFVVLVMADGCQQKKKKKVYFFRTSIKA